jgi:hypothetical protein
MRFVGVDMVVVALMQQKTRLSQPRSSGPFDFAFLCCLLLVISVCALHKFFVTIGETSSQMIQRRAHFKPSVEKIYKQAKMRTTLGVEKKVFRRRSHC